MDKCIISNKEFIGEGSNWSVYKCLLNESENIILKIRKHNFDINSSLNNYKYIKDLGLNTLSFYYIQYHDNSEVIITNDINNSEYIYVTSNGVVTNLEKMLREISGKSPKKESIAEKFRYENKIEKINNFEDFLRKCKKEIKLASNSNLLLDSDCYFFGTLRNSKISDIQYIICDVDNIFSEQKNPYEQNIINFKDSLLNFIEYFVENKSEYINSIELIIN